MSRPGGIIQFSSFANVRGKHGDRAGSNTRGAGCRGQRSGNTNTWVPTALTPPFTPQCWGLTLRSQTLWEVPYHSILLLW